MNMMARAWARIHKQNLAGTRLGKPLHAQKPKPKPHRGNLARKALHLAATQIGVKENPAGSNHTKYGVWYGADHEPWCAIFVSWVLTHSGRPFKYAYVPAIVADALNTKNGLRAIPFKHVQAHLNQGVPVLACYDWEHNGTADHVGFVEKVIDGASFRAIEGNTGDTNLSNGGEVMNPVRPANLVQAFVAVDPHFTA